MKFKLFLMLFWASCLSGFACPNSDDSAQPNVRFVVLDKRNNRPIDSAIVTISSPIDIELKQLFTDINGIAETHLHDSSDYHLKIGRRFGPDSSYLTEVRSFRKIGGTVIDTTKLWYNRGCNPRYFIPNLYFKSNSLKSEDTATLHLWFELLVENPMLQVELDSYSDCQGGKEVNRAISKQRVEAVADYLAEKGIDRKRLMLKVFGDERPVIDCNCGSKKCTEEDYAKNRRIEFKIAKL